MGYQRSTLRLVFSDPQFEGLEVRMRRLPIGSLVELTRFADVVRVMGPDNSPDTAAAFDQIVSTVEGGLISWNVEDPVTGIPVTADRRGIETSDFEMIMVIVEAWMDAAVNVSVPLGKTSNGSARSVEASLLMAPLSPSLPN